MKLWFRRLFLLHRGDFFSVNSKNHQDWIPGRVCKGKAVIWTDEHYVPWHFLGEAFFSFKQSFHLTSLHFTSLIFAFPSFHFISCHVIPFISFSISFPFIYLRGSFHFIPSNIPRSPSTPLPPLISHLSKPTKSLGLDIVASHQITTLSTFR